MRDLSDVFSLQAKTYPRWERLRILKLCFDNVTLIGHMLTNMDIFFRVELTSK